MFIISKFLFFKNILFQSLKLYDSYCTVCRYNKLKTFRQEHNKRVNQQINKASRMPDKSRDVKMKKNLILKYLLECLINTFALKMYFFFLIKSN